jgi:hypothetical protein
MLPSYISIPGISCAISASVALDMCKNTAYPKRQRSSPDPRTRRRAPCAHRVGLLSYPALKVASRAKDRNHNDHAALRGSSQHRRTRRAYARIFYQHLLTYVEHLMAAFVTCRMYVHFSVRVHVHYSDGSWSSVASDWWQKIKVNGCTSMRISRRAYRAICEITLSSAREINGSRDTRYVVRWGRSRRRRCERRARRHAEMRRRARDRLRELELQIRTRSGSATAEKPTRDPTP